jgi:hypothetical protein
MTDMRTAFIEASDELARLYAAELFTLPLKAFLRECRLRGDKVRQLVGRLSPYIGKKVDVVVPKVQESRLYGATLTRIILTEPKGKAGERKDLFELRAELEGCASPRLLRHCYPAGEAPGAPVNKRRAAKKVPRYLGKGPVVVYRKRKRAGRPRKTLHKEKE